MKQDIRKIVKEGYEKGNYAGNFRTNDKPFGIEKQYLDHLISFLPNHAKILDFGCGVGIPFDKYLAEKGFDVTGIDIARNHIQQAKKNVPKATYIEDDFTKKDFGSTKFHAIIAFYSIFHIPKEEHAELLKTMFNLLRDEGIILMTLGTHTEDNIEDDWCGSTMAWSSHDPDTYRLMIADCGFEVVKEEFEGKPGDQEYHWWIMVKKIIQKNKE